MKRNTMSFKAIINNMAKENNVAAQSVLQTYMLEKLLERISISKYKDNFILKGGMLISAMLGIDSRTTMDMDTTIKGLPLTKDNITNIMDEICNIEIDDNVTLKINKVELIREDDDYGGYRITFEAKYNNEMPVIMKIDITTGDKITYKEIEYSFTLMLEDRKIQIWSYNVETIIAEKFEAIVKRGVLSTRIRDYYDVYMLINTQNKIIDKKTLKDAITLTAQHRGTNEIIKDWKKIVEKIANDSKMRQQWKRYQKDNFYAEEIEYKDLINAISKVGEIFDN
ncbi:MAG TPA: abortive phage infection protein [Clostridiales bacterium]|nr:abortive phage infection protein [Clostridiales bacterium]